MSRPGSRYVTASLPWIPRTLMWGGSLLQSSASRQMCLIHKFYGSATGELLLVPPAREAQNLVRKVDGVVALFASAHVEPLSCVLGHDFVQREPHAVTHPWLVALHDEQTR